LALFLALAGISFVCRATEPTQPESVSEISALDTVVVTATRTPTATMDVPASVSVITVREVETKTAASTPELLKHEVGVLYNEVSESLQMNGRSTDDVMVLVDGVPSFTPFNNDANLESIAIESIERIEVVRGPASSLYGGNAVSGVINITTKRPVDNDITVTLGAANNDTWRKSVSAQYLFNDQLGLSMGWEEKTSDGYMQRYARVASSATSSTGTQGSGARILPNGTGGNQYIVGERGRRGYNRENLWLKLHYDFDAARALTYSFSHYEYEGKTTGAKSYIRDANNNPLFSGSALLPDGRWVNFSESSFTDYINRKKVLTHAFQYRDTENEVSINLGLSDVRDMGYNSGSYLDKSRSGGMAEYPGKTYNLDAQKVWNGFKKHTLVTGFTLRQDEMDYRNWSLDHWGSVHSKNTLNYDSGGKATTMALFVQDEFAFAEKWKLFAGLRFDRYRNREGYSNHYGNSNYLRYPSSRYHEFSPKLAVEFKPDESSSYYASYGHSFSPPQLYHLYRTSSYSPSGSYHYVGNPWVTPETSDTFEIGIKKRLTRELTLNAHAFESKTKDAIVAIQYPLGEFPVYLDPNIPVRAYTNVDREKRRGASVSLDYRPDRNYRAFLNYTWQEGKYTGGSSQGTIISGIPKHLLHTGIAYNDEKWQASLNGTYVSQRNAPGTPTGIYYLSYDPYFIADLRVAYKILKTLRLSLFVNNLFDREYYQDYIAPRRTYGLEVRLGL
jgi:iron complex outermembrane receptor protein